MKASSRITLALVLVGTVAAALAASAGARIDDRGSGFKTSAPALLTAVKPGVEITPLITVGETLPGGYMFESIPDGISIEPRGRGSDNARNVDIYVNHETSTVPFPFTAPDGPGFNDFTNALVSKLSLDHRSAGVLSGSYVIPSSANYQRFCSNFLATKQHGFTRDILFTNEEAIGRRQPDRDRLARNARQRLEPGAGRRGRGLRREERRVQDDLRHGPPQPREQRRAAGLRRAGRALRRRHVRRRPRRSSTSTTRTRPTSSGPTRARSTRSRPTTRPRTTTATSRQARTWPADSSRSRRRSPRATRTRSRTGRTRTTSSSSSGLRTSPTTVGSRTSSTSPTRASRERCQTRSRPDGSAAAAARSAAPIRTGACSSSCSTRTTRC